MRDGRCNAVDGGLTSPTLGVGGNLLCEIVQFGSFWGAHPSRMLVSASRRNDLFSTRESRSLVIHEKSAPSRDSLARMRDAGAPQSNLRRSSLLFRPLAWHNKPRRLLRPAKQRLNK